MIEPKFKLDHKPNGSWLYHEDVAPPGDGPIHWIATEEKSMSCVWRGIGRNGHNEEGTYTLISVHAIKWAAIRAAVACAHADREELMAPRLSKVSP